MKRRICLAMGLLALLAGCSASPGVATGCTPAMGPAILVFDLFFGRTVPGQGDVTDREWTDFVDRIVTPNLPHGFTLSDAAGAWMNPATRGTIHERTKVLKVALPEDADSLAAVERIRTAYQLQYHQELVGMTVEHACGSF